MASLHHQHYVLERLTEAVGHPILDVVSDYPLALTRAIEAALLEYWGLFPYTWSQRVSAAGAAQVDWLYEQAFPAPSELSFTTETNLVKARRRAEHRRSARLASSIYYVGVLRVSDSVRNFNYSDFNSKLLGTDIAHALDSVRQATLDPRHRLDVEEDILQATYVDLDSGEFEYRYDPLKRQIDYIMPSQVSSMHVWHGFGFHCYEAEPQLLETTAASDADGSRTQFVQVLQSVPLIDKDHLLKVHNSAGVEVAQFDGSAFESAMTSADPPQPLVDVSRCSWTPSTLTLTIEFTTAPAAQATFGINYHVDDDTLDCVKAAYLPLFTKLALRKFLHTVITSLTLAQPSTDVSIDPNAVQSMHDTIKDELLEELPLYTSQVALWG